MAAQAPKQQPPVEPELDVEGQLMEPPDTVIADGAKVIDVTDTDGIALPPSPLKTRH